jgi:hypothetical protein
MNFTRMRKEMEEHISSMLMTSTRLYQVDVTGEELWDLYLASFPPGTNPVYRKRTEHDCSCCRNFIRQFGGIVAIDAQYRRKSIWDFETPETGYQPVLDALRDRVMASPVRDVLVSADRLLGTEHSLEEAEGGEIVRWSHFFIKLPKNMLCRRGSEATFRGNIRTSVQTLQRALQEISGDALADVMELISQNSLYRGESHTHTLEAFQTLRTKYLAAADKDLFCWREQTNASPAVCGIRNSSIGTLLMDLSAGMDLEDAVSRYEAITAPSNYKRPKALVTEATLNKARETIEELGVLDSLPHRFAHLEDITVDNVLFADKGSVTEMKGTVLDDLAKEVKQTPRKFGKVEEVEWERFLRDYLPSATSLEIMLEGRHAGNLVSLLAPVNPEAPRVFQWDNGFCWAYKGNLADSMKERVKAAGGDVTGVLRFSIQWNEDGRTKDDLDAHCILPNCCHIYYNNKYNQSSRGELDVDIINPTGVAVENITWPSLSDMPDGEYQFYVHCYSDRGTIDKGGFTAEIEANGDIQEFTYNIPLRQDEKIPVATVVKKGGEFTIKASKAVSQGPGKGREMWGVTCGQFQKVTSVMYSPNFWDDQRGRGSRHVLFMLDGCVSDESPSGFFNEYLREEMRPHRKVLEMVGTRMRVEPDPRQCSGLGFCTTKRSSVTVRVKGNVERVVKVLF